MPTVKSAKPIPTKLLTQALEAPTTTKHHVRLVLSVNNAITLIRVWVEGTLVPKWTEVSGFLVWENKEQPVTGPLDVEVELWGTPEGEASLATVCDGQQCGDPLNVATTNGHGVDSASYDV